MNKEYKKTSQEELIKLLLDVINTHKKSFIKMECSPNLLYDLQNLPCAKSYYDDVNFIEILISNCAIRCYVSFDLVGASVEFRVLN